MNDRVAVIAIVVEDEDSVESVNAILHEYKEKEYRSITSGDLGFENAEEMESVKNEQTERKELLDFIKESLGNQVSEVRLSGNLSDHPVSLSSTGPISIGMEKVLNSMPTGEKVKADRVLELNNTHHAFKALCEAWDAEDKDRVKLLSEILYDEAQLIEGLPLANPTAFVDKISNLF